MKDIKAIGKNIKEYRESLGLTQRELGNLMGCHNSLISNYERGKVKDISLAEIERLAKYLKVEIRDITGWDNPYRIPEGYEDKYRICKLFTPVLRECRAFPDLLRLDYEKTDERETVTAVIEDPTGMCSPTLIEIDVTADSGIALLSDIIRALG